MSLCHSSFHQDSHGMPNPGPISPSMPGDPMTSSTSGYGPNGMMQGPGMGMPPPVRSFSGV